MLNTFGILFISPLSRPCLGPQCCLVKLELLPALTYEIFQTFTLNDLTTNNLLCWSKTCWHHPWARTGSRPGRGAGSYDLSEAVPSQPRDLNCRRGPVHFASFNPQRGCNRLKPTSHDTEASTLSDSLPGSREVPKTLVRLFILLHVSVYYCGWSSTNSLNPCKTVRPKYSITAQ